MKRGLWTLLCAALVLTAAWGLVSCGPLDWILPTRSGADGSRTVTFFVEGKVYATRKAEAGGTVPAADMPEAPEVSHLDFLGWFADESGTVPFDPAVNNRAYAKLTPHVYLLTYQLDGGTVSAPGSYLWGQAFSVGPAVREGFDFLGWTSERFEGMHASVEFPAGFEGDVTLSAHWSPSSYALVYANAWNNPNPTSYVSADLPLTLVAPTREGYTFAGWTGAGVNGAKAVTIPAGFAGDVRLTAAWEPVAWDITYDLGGGTASGNPAAYTVESATFALVRPTRPGYVFVGWTGTALTEPTDTVTVPRGSTGARTYVAHWTPAPIDLTFAARVGGEEVPGIPLTYREEGELRLLLAPGETGEYVFSHWTCNGEVFSRSPFVRFTPAGVMDFAAVYERQTPMTFDKARAAGGLTLTATLTSPVRDVLGGSLMAGDWYLREGSEGKEVVWDPDYLLGLPTGCYDYLLYTDGGQVCLRVRVTDSRCPTDLVLEYDTECHPDVLLLFSCDCGGTHSYSLDGGAAVLCHSGDVIAGFDKSRDHTLVLTCAGGGTARVTSRGWTEESRPFFETFFSWGGRTYDYAPDTVDEFAALLAYLALVRGVEDVTLARESEPGAVETAYYEFWPEGEVASLCETGEATQSTVSLLLSAVSLPMTPRYGVAWAPETVRRSVRFVYEGGLNEKTSDYPVRPCAPDRQGLWPDTPTRGPEFDGFAIDALTATVTVRTVYELEQLPFGCRPVFASTALARTAREAYEAAREICRTVVSDTMTDYEKVAAFYAWLGLCVTYDNGAYTDTLSSDYRAYTLCGPLLDHLAVCDGYASAMRLLCQIEGIECVEVTGRQKKNDPLSGHAWNKVRLGGVWYGLDATWCYLAPSGGETEGLVSMRYLFLDEEALTEAGHYENVTDKCAGRTGTVATGRVNWYAMTSDAPGCDREIGSAAELIATVRAAVAAGVEVVEIHVADESLLSEQNMQALMAAVDAANLSIKTSEGGYYFLSFAY